MGATIEEFLFGRQRRFMAKKRIKFWRLPSLCLMWSFWGCGELGVGAKKLFINSLYYWCNWIFGCNFNNILDFVDFLSMSSGLLAVCLWWSLYSSTWVALVRFLSTFNKLFPPPSKKNLQRGILSWHGLLQI